MTNVLVIDGRPIGNNEKPYVIVEIGINHGGDIIKAKQMVKDAYHAGAECVKFQCHILEDEMVAEAQNIIPSNSELSIFDIMSNAAFSYEEELSLKKYVESFGMTYLSTPFSRAAAERLERMNVVAFKIGSGECNNYPLIKHISSFGKPIILSTGMNDIDSIKKAVEIFQKYGIKYALLHCTSMYPTPYEKVRLGAIKELQKNFPSAVIGLSDHSIGNYTCFAAIPLGARILEKHFTSDKKWEGPDVPISLDPNELRDLIYGSSAIFHSLGGSKDILPEEKSTINFAYASVVTISNIKEGEILTEDNIWVKRPGVGELRASDYAKVLGRVARRDLKENLLLSWDDLDVE